MSRFTVFTFLLMSLVACGSQPAVLPNSVTIAPANSVQSKELELSQQAAQDAAKSAREASLESEKVQRQIAELKSEVQRLSVLASGCADLSKKADQKRAAAAALKAKKEAEEKKAAEEAAVALPQPTTSAVKGDYSRSDAPPGYYPEKPAPHAPVTNDKH